MERESKLTEAVAAHPIYQELLRAGSYVTTTVGESMLPLLRERRDSVKLVPAPATLRRGDAVLYLRRNGKLVLHRVRDVRPEGYTMCGDAQTHCEYGVPHAAILGVMEGYWRDERYIPCTAKRYRFYVWIWCLSLRLRRVLLWVTGIGRKRKK